MNVAREAVSQALFDLLYVQSLKDLCKKITRTPQIWTEVADADMPFLVLFKGGPATEEYVQPQSVHIALTKYTLHYNLWLYLKSDPTGTVVAETTINNIADQIDIALKAPTSGNAPGGFGERQTLGGIVNNVYLDGGSEWGREFEDNNITVFWRITVETGQ